MLQLTKNILSYVEPNIYREIKKKIFAKKLLSLAPSTVFLLQAEKKKKDIFLFINTRDRVSLNYIPPFKNRTVLNF